MALSVRVTVQSVDVADERRHSLTLLMSVWEDGHCLLAEAFPQTWAAGASLDAVRAALARRMAGRLAQFQRARRLRDSSGLAKMLAALEGDLSVTLYHV